VHEATVSETASLALAGAPDGTTVTGHVCDVADEAQVLRFRDEVLAAHAADHVDLVFSNAGIGGGGSFIADPREQWESVFGVDFWGVYYCARAFLPLLIASGDGVLVNTSSVNGFWASLGPGVPHTAYSAAKFAVKGFSEALIEDFRINAPHVQVSVVMPGHIGTDIVLNSQRIHARNEPGRDRFTDLRAGMQARGMSTEGMTDEQLDELMVTMASMFREAAPMTAAQAASEILAGVLDGRWRLLIGKDAVQLDESVRADPEKAYGPGGLTLGILGGIGS
jgi:NAD(P)-dependent dehydrogenase (short-subunit alcohol dehydrogenase family)